jgi:O-antigen/teichoic acid export membrane protein
MLVILAKLGSPEMVGQFALGLAITAPIIIFANLSLRAVQATDAKQAYHFGDYLGLRVVTSFLALVLISGIGWVAGYRQETAWIIFFIGLAKAVEAISDVFYGLFQQHERMDRIAWSMMMKGLLSLVALAIGVYVTNSVLGGVVGLTLMWIVILVGYDVRNGFWIFETRDALREQGRRAAELRPQWDISVMHSLIWLTMPLGVATMLVSLNANIPRYFIERYWGQRELGLFTAMAYLTVAGGTVVNALGQSAAPRLARFYATGNRSAFSKLLLKLVMIGALLGGISLLVVLFGGRPILTILYKAEYTIHIDVFIWLTIAAAVSYVGSFLGYGMTASRYFRVQPAIFALSVALSCICCFLLVPRFGLLGAAWTILLTSCFQAVAALASNAHAIYRLYGKT